MTPSLLSRGTPCDIPPARKPGHTALPRHSLKLAGIPPPCRPHARTDLPRCAASSRRSRVTGWRRCMCWRSVPGCGRGSCLGYAGRTWTWSTAGCSWSAAQDPPVTPGGGAVGAGRNGVGRPSRAAGHRARAAGVSRESKAWSFPTPSGKPLDPHNLRQRSFFPLLDRAGLPRIRFHDLRHSCATLLLGEGVHPKIVSDLLGTARSVSPWICTLMSRRRCRRSRLRRWVGCSATRTVAGD